MESSLALKLMSGSERMVYMTGMPGVTRVMSPSEISILFSIRERSATCTMVGVV